MKNEKNVSKKIRKIIIIALICVCVAVFLFIQIYPNLFSLGIKKHDTQSYISSEYKTFSGGYTASEFFPDPEELGDYESLDFYFVNNILRFSIFYGRFGNTFMLDVVYGEESFDAVVLKIFSAYKCSDLYKECLLDLFWLDDFYVVQFKAGSIDKDQSFYLCINEKEKKIRFLLLENGDLYSIYRRLTDFNTSMWDTKVAVQEPEYVKTVKEKYDSYIGKGIAPFS